MQLCVAARCRWLSVPCFQLFFSQPLTDLLDNRARRPGGPELAMKVKNVGVVRVSPDGRKVAYTVSQAVMTPERSEYVTQIWLANTDGSDPLQLTFADKSSDNPRWSPDGRLIAFTSGRSGKNNLYALRIIGGEAEQLTDVKSGVCNFVWSPNGDRIAFLMKDGQNDDEEKGS